MSAAEGTPALLPTGETGTAGAARPARKGVIAERTVLVNIFTNWAWYLLVIASGFILPRFIDRYQGQDLLGAWDFAWSIVFYVELMALGIRGAISRYTARYRATQDWPSMNETVNSCLLMLAACAVIGIASVTVFCEFLPSVMSKASPDTLATAYWAVMLLSLKAALQLPGSVFNAVITGYERFDTLNLIRGIRDAAILVVDIVVLINGGGIIAMAIVVLIGELLGDLAKYVTARKLCPQMELSTGLFRASVCRTMIGFGGKALLRDIGRSGLYHMNLLFVAHFLSVGLTAVFARQRSLVMHLMRFMRQYAQVFMPTTSALDAQDAQDATRRLLVQSSRLGMYVTVPVVIVLVIMGDLLVHLWMGPKYIATGVLVILAVGHVLAIGQSGVYSILMGVDSHGWPALYEVMAAGVSIVMTFVCLSLGGGLEAAAWSIAVPVTIAGGIATPIHACKCLKLSVGRYFSAVLVGPTLTSIPLAVCLWLARLRFETEYGKALIVGLAAGGVVTLVVYWFVVVPRRLRRHVVDRVMRIGRVSHAR
ncbi:MAG: oligosaccharide flippase family protein [Phycisphaerales bacterium]|nr:oligosaccharide flippase family protein [Phycisphaerales bacterium]